MTKGGGGGKPDSDDEKEREKDIDKEKDKKKKSTRSVKVSRTIPSKVDEEKVRTGSAPIVEKKKKPAEEAASDFRLRESESRESRDGEGRENKRSSTKDGEGKKTSQEKERDRDKDRDRSRIVRHFSTFIRKAKTEAEPGSRESGQLSHRSMTTSSSSSSSSSRKVPPSAFLVSSSAGDVGPPNDEDVPLLLSARAAPRDGKVSPTRPLSGVSQGGGRVSPQMDPTMMMIMGPRSRRDLSHLLQADKPPSSPLKSELDFADPRPRLVALESAPPRHLLLSTEAASLPPNRHSPTHDSPTGGIMRSRSGFRIDLQQTGQTGSPLLRTLPNVRQSRPSHLRSTDDQSIDDYGDGSDVNTPRKILTGVFGKFWKKDKADDLRNFSSPTEMCDGDSDYGRNDASRNVQLSQLFFGGAFLSGKRVLVSVGNVVFGTVATISVVYMDTETDTSIPLPSTFFIEIVDPAGETVELRDSGDDGYEYTPLMAGRHWVRLIFSPGTYPLIIFPLFCPVRSAPLLTQRTAVDSNLKMAFSLSSLDVSAVSGFVVLTVQAISLETLSSVSYWDYLADTKLSVAPKAGKEERLRIADRGNYHFKPRRSGDHRVRLTCRDIEVMSFSLPLHGSSHPRGHLPLQSNFAESNSSLVFLENVEN